MAMDVVDYEIKGAEMQFVEVELDPGEAAVGEAGSMMFMDAGIAHGHGVRRRLGAAGRPLRQAAGRRQAAGHRRVAVHHRLHEPAPRPSCGWPSPRPYPGKILPMDLRAARRHADLPEGRLPVRRARRVAGHRASSASWASASSAARASSCRSSRATAWPSCMPAAAVLKRELQPGQTLMVDTGCVVAYTPDVDFEIQYVGKIKTALFGGEGLFFAKLTGPGTVWLQSLPFSRLASRVFAAAPQTGGRRAARARCSAASPAAACSAACSAATTSRPPLAQRRPRCRGLAGRCRCRGRLARGRPAAAGVDLEAMTSPELRERIAAGATTALVPIGGTEQNGAAPRAGQAQRARAACWPGGSPSGWATRWWRRCWPMCPRAASTPPTEHMRWAGTISIPDAGLRGRARRRRAPACAGTACARSCCSATMAATSAALARVARRVRQARAGSALPRARPDRVLPGRAVRASRAWLARQGYAAAEIGSHAGLADTALSLAVDPTLVRPALQARGAQRRRARRPAPRHAPNSARAGVAHDRRRTAWRRSATAPAGAGADASAAQSDRHDISTRGLTSNDLAPAPRVLAMRSPAACWPGCAGVGRADAATAPAPACLPACRLRRARNVYSETGAGRMQPGAAGRPGAHLRAQPARPTTSMSSTRRR